jgi:hypothetical protein
MSRRYVKVVIITPAASAEDMNQLIAATAAEGATDKSLGAPVWDESTPMVLGTDGWPNLAVMPPPEFLVAEGFLDVLAAAQLPEDTAGEAP